MAETDEITEREELVRSLYGAGFEDSGDVVFGKESRRPVLIDSDVSPTITAEDSGTMADSLVFHEITGAERSLDAVFSDTKRITDDQVNQSAGYSIAQADQLARNVIQRAAELETVTAQRHRDFLSDVGIAVAAVSPLMGLQQSLYGFMSGEGWGAINRVWPTVVMEDSEGVARTRASASVGLELLRDRVMGNADEGRQKAAELLDATHRDFRTYVDVLETNIAGFGPTNILPEEGLSEEQQEMARVKMDAILSDTNVAGRAALSAGCGIMDMFCDPLLLADRVPVAAFQLGRAALHPTTRAVATSKIAQRVGRLWDHTTNVKNSEKELHAAQAAFDRSATRSNSMRLGAAKGRYTEAKHMDAIASTDPGPHETVLLPTHARVNPNKIVPKNYVDEVVSYSPTRGVDAETRKATMLRDIQDQIDRANLSPSEDADRAIDAWSRRYKEIEAMDPENMPAGITSGGANTASTINAEINAARREALGREYQPIYDWTDPSIEPWQLEMRTYFGPDMAEEYSEALRMMVIGADPDDVLVKGIMTPEYMAAMDARPRAVTVDGKIDMRKLAAQNDLTPEMHGMVRKGMALSPGDTKFDMRWLPDVPKVNPLMDPATYDKPYKWLSDRVAPGLYPLSTVVRPPAMLRAGANLLMREPLRVLETQVPGAWKDLRNSLREVDFERDRLIGRFSRLLKDAGALSDDGKHINEAANRQIYQLLDVEPTDPAFAAMMEAATPEMRTATRQLRGTLEYLAEKQALPGTERYISGYISHVFGPKMFAGGAFPPDMHGISPNAKLFIQHLMPRTSNARVYPQDAVSALDLMSRGVSRKLHLEPALDRLLAGAEKQPRWYRTYTNMLVANLKGQPSTLGSMLDHVAGTMASAGGVQYKAGAAGRANMSLVSAAYSSALTGNMRYPWMAIGTGLATTSSSYGALRTQRALFSMGTAEGQLAAKASGIEKQWSQILETPAMSGFSNWASRARILGPSIMDTEFTIRGLSYLAAADDLMTRKGIKSWDEAVELGVARTIMAESARVAEETNHFFGVAGKPPLFGRVSKSGSAAATQFLSFIPKQTEELAAQALRNPGYIGRYLMMSGWIQRMAAEELGITMDQYVGFGYMPKETGETTSIALDVALSQMGWMSEMSNTMAGRGDPMKLERATKDLIESHGLLVPLMQAGRQWKRRATTLGTGEVRDTRGLRRKVDLGDFDPTDISTLPQIFGSTPGQPTEAISIVSQVESVQGRLERENQAAMRRVLKDEAFAVHRLSMAFVRAADGGDMAQVSARMQDLTDAGFPIPEVESLLEARMIADALERNMRIMIENPELTVPFAEATRELGREQSK